MDALANEPKSAMLEELEREPERSSRDEEEEEEDDDDDDDDYIKSITGVRRPSHPITSPRHNGRQTGPKGVIADHAYYKHVQAQAQASQIRAHNARIAAQAATTTTHREDEQAKGNGEKGGAARTQDELLIQALDVEEDAEALRQYRETRMEELRRLGEQGKKFGALSEINAAQYASAIDNEYKTVAVVIHIFDNSVPQCRPLNEHLSQLARKYAGAKFLRIQARELEFDVAGLPAILAYKGGVLVANLVHVTEQIGETGFDADRVEDVLLRSGALNEDDIIDTPAFNSMRSGPEGDD